LLVRQALSRLSYSPSGHAIRDKESNLDLRVQSAASCRLDDPGTRRAPVAGAANRIEAGAPLRPSPNTGRSTQQASATRRAWSRPLSRPLEAGRCFPCHSPTLRPWITDHSLRTLRSADVLRGGALEPEPRMHLLEKRRLKQTLIASVPFRRAAPRVFLSQAGPRFDLELVQAEHHLWFRVD
jgi:hypothetical protein